MATFSALLALCAGNSPITSEFPAQRPVMRNFDAFFDLRPAEQTLVRLVIWDTITLIISVAYRYRKSISIIELFVSIYIDIYRVLSN